ncbi:MAG: Fe-S-containing hydro-lyase [Lentisphaeria bacterium]|nr:Fe-S-containing hydro-lyase [Lentisphaeria bacterium]
MIKKLQTPFTVADARELRAGDEVRLTGTIWTGRDAAHKKLVALLESGAELPVDLKDQIIYFVGPCPAPPGRPIGSAGPTTSGRMDAYSPILIARCGLTGMIGKGGRSSAVVDAMKAHGAVYFGATGGAGALIARKIKSCEVVAFPELGTEAIHKLYVEDFPLVVAIDAEGNSLYD